MDHQRPVANGGDHTYANMQASHHVCNLIKGDSLGTRNTRPRVIATIDEVYAMLEPVGGGRFEQDGVFDLRPEFESSGDMFP